MKYKIRNIVSSKHNSVKRDYLKRMFSQKIHSMQIAKKYDYSYWDGSRKYGYGGYKYIPDYWKNSAKKIIKIYRLNNKSKILDVGCGKGFLLYELKKILPGLKTIGYDISRYAINNAKKEIKKNLFIHKAQNKTKFKNNYFDLLISVGCLHNLHIYDLEKSIKEINRISKKAYLMVESYRNNKELFNLQCWALTASTFFSTLEWKWVLNNFKYKGDIEFIYFK